MVARLTEQQLEALRKLDSPTVANAVERFKVRRRVEGYAGYQLRCVFPELGTMLGYAVTCTADSTTEERANSDGLLQLWEALEHSPKPAVLVIKDIGSDRTRSCHLGEVMATTARALGAVGCVSDGGLRDILAVKALGGFQLFCPGFVVSHGNPVICDVGGRVELCGLQVSPGDLLHGDINGLLAIPEEVASKVDEAAARIRERERKVLELVKTPNFSTAKLREFQRKFPH